MKTPASTLLAIVAIGISVGTLLLSIDWKIQDNTLTTSEERIEQLEREIAHLKGTVLETDLVANEGMVLTIEQNEVANSATSDQERINRLVQSMRWTMTVKGLMNPSAEHIEKAHRYIFDDETSVKRKLVAMRILQSCGRRSDEVARKMIDVYYETSDFELQAEIFNVLDDMDTPELAQAILEASSSSPSPRVRKEAVDALSGFLPNPELLEWLQQVSTTDKDKGVRREADRLIKKHSGVAAN